LPSISLESLPEGITYSCSDASVRFFPQRSIAWLNYGLRKGVFQTTERTVTGSTDNPWHIIRLSLNDVRDIAIASWNSGKFTPEEFKETIGRVLEAGLEYKKIQRRKRR